MLRAMADNQLIISTKQDATMFNIFANNQDFVFKNYGNEFEVSSSTSSFLVTLKTGGCIICGRHVYEEQTEEGTTSLQLLPNSSGYLIIRYDLTQAAGKEAVFTQVENLTMEDLNNNGLIRDLPLYSFQTDNDGVSSITDVREIKDCLSPVEFSIENGKVFYSYKIGDETIKKVLGSLDPATLTATPADVLSGKVFGGKDSDTSQTGTMPNNGAISKAFTPSKSSQSYTISKGYHDGNGKVTCNPIPSGTVNCNRKGSGILTSGNQVIDTGDSGTKKGIFVGVFNGTAYIDGSNDNSSWTTLGTYKDNGSSSSFTNSSTSGYLQNQTYRYIRIRFVTWDNGIAGKAFYSVFSAE